MQIEDRILFLENGSPCIFFPVGKASEGGTCHYMTKECWENCPSGGVVHEHEIRAYKYFCESKVPDIVTRIIKELKYFKTDFLGWFSWGDCPPSLVNKVYHIIMELNIRGIVQNGFTRNRELWEKIPCLPDLRFSISADTEEEAIRISTDKTVCFPDVNKAEANVFVNGKNVAKCTGYFCRHIPQKRTVEADCVVCYKNKEGCFT